MSSYLLAVTICCLLCIGHSKLCRQNEYLDGSWVYNNVSRQSNKYSASMFPNFLVNRTANDFAFHCCPGENVHPDMPALCHKNQSIYQSKSPTNGQRDCCSCVLSTTPFQNANEASKWEWTPNNCELLSFEAIPFCHLLQGRYIVFMGDSMTRNTADNIYSLLEQGAGNCKDFVQYDRSPFLHFSFKALDKVLSEVVINKKPDIVIMNAGAYLQNKDEMRVEVMPRLYQQLAYIDQFNKKRKETKKTKYYWRTQYGGHEHCLLYREPILHYDPLKYIVRHRADNDSVHNITYKQPYNWHYFQQFDVDAKNAIHKGGVMSLLDVSPMYLRADAHRGIVVARDGA